MKFYRDEDTVSATQWLVELTAHVLLGKMHLEPTKLPDRLIWPPLNTANEHCYTIVFNDVVDARAQALIECFEQNFPGAKCGRS